MRYYACLEIILLPVSCKLGVLNPVAGNFSCRKCLFRKILSFGFLKNYLVLQNIRHTSCQCHNIFSIWSGLRTPLPLHHVVVSQVWLLMKGNGEARFLFKFYFLLMFTVFTNQAMLESVSKDTRGGDGCNPVAGIPLYPDVWLGLGSPNMSGCG